MPHGKLRTMIDFVMDIQDFAPNSGRSLDTGNMAILLNASENKHDFSQQQAAAWVLAADALKVNVSVTYSSITYNLW